MWISVVPNCRILGYCATQSTQVCNVFMWRTVQERGQTMQSLKFSDLEGLRIACEMERRGNEFYRHTAKISKSDEAKALLIRLADDEVEHEREFAMLAETMLKNCASEEEEQFYNEEVSAYLSAIAAEVVFSSGLMSLVPDNGFDSPRAILLNAIQSEKDAILFYTEMAHEARSEQARQVFKEIVDQEKGHLVRLQNQLDELAAEE